MRLWRWIALILFLGGLGLEPADAAPDGVAIVLAQLDSYQEIPVDPPPSIDGVFRYKFRILRVLAGHTSRTTYYSTSFGSPTVPGAKVYALLDEKAFEPKAPYDGRMVITGSHAESGPCLDTSLAEKHGALSMLKRVWKTTPCAR